MSILSAAKPVAYVYVRDRARAKAYYADVIGLTLQEDDAHGMSFALAGGASLRITEMKDHAASPHPALGFAVADIRAVMAALRGKGVSFKIYPGFGQDADGLWASPDGATRLAWFEDPDGNLLMLNQG